MVIGIYWIWFLVPNSSLEDWLLVLGVDHD